MLRKTEGDFEVLGRPEGIERLGGIDFDAAVFAHVARSLDGALEELDEDDPAAIAAVARLRADCVEAKEALSADTDTTIPVLLPNLQTEVRITRNEFENMIRPSLSDSIGAMRRAFDSAGVTAEQVQAVLLVGGSSRIPLVAQLVGSELGRPVAVDTHPKHAVPLGAAIAAAHAAGELDDVPTPAPSEPPALPHPHPRRAPRLRSPPRRQTRRWLHLHPHHRWRRHRPNLQPRRRPNPNRRPIARPHRRLLPRRRHRRRDARRQPAVPRPATPCRRTPTGRLRRERRPQAPTTPQAARVAATTAATAARACSSVSARWCWWPSSPAQPSLSPVAAATAMTTAAPTPWPGDSTDDGDDGADATDEADAGDDEADAGDDGADDDAEPTPTEEPDEPTPTPTTRPSPHPYALAA